MFKLESKINPTLKNFNLNLYFTKVYARKHLIFSGENKGLKDLLKICSDQHIDKSNAIMIGDSRLDLLSSEKANIYFLKVPPSSVELRWHLRSKGLRRSFPPTPVP